ncbi:MAG: hypothetical protein AB7P03_06955 [Kofleriaceae bacterium]
MTRRRDQSYEDTIDDARAQDFDPTATELSAAPDFESESPDDDAPTRQLELSDRPITKTDLDVVAAPAAPDDSIRMISMKTPGTGDPQPKPERALPKVRLRSLSGLRRRQPQVATAMPRGNLAPPRDPRQARARRLRDLVLWASLVEVLASAVTLAIWFLAAP